MGKEQKTLDFKALAESGKEERKESKKCKARESELSGSRERRGWLHPKSAVGIGRRLEFMWHHTSGLQQAF